MNFIELIKQAEKHFDLAEYEEAVDCYEQALLLDDANLSFLSALTTAWDYKHISYLEKVIAKYPKSYGTHRLRDDLLAKQSPKNAIKWHTKSLKEFGENPALALQIRSLRFQTALRENKVSTFLEDFYLVWDNFTLSVQRKAIIKQLCTAKDEVFCSIFLELSNDERFSPELRQVFEQQATHIKAIAVLNL